jgi:hypothetical protein
MKTLSRLLREPLLHFLAIGIVIFVAYSAVVQPDTAEPTDTIVVGPERINQLVESYKAVWRRAPTDDEMQVIIDNFVREEIYYREGLALGLDRNDAIVRRRVQQKMEFLTDAGADLLQPSDDELAAYYAANQRNYERGPQLAFEQVFLGENTDPENVKQALNALRSDPAIAPANVGTRSLLPPRIGLSHLTAIDGSFGKGFFEQIAELPVDAWSGPVASGYGVHLVRITDRLTASTPALEDVRQAVLQDWKAAKASKIRELQYARYRERYAVEIHSAKTDPEETR